MKKNIMYRFISWVGIVFLFLGINIGFSDYIHNSGYDTSETISNSDQTIANKGTRYNVYFIYREYSEKGTWVTHKASTTISKSSHYDTFFSDVNDGDFNAGLSKPGYFDSASLPVGTYGPYESKTDANIQYRVIVEEEIKKTYKGINTYSGKYHIEKLNLATVVITENDNVSVNCSLSVLSNTKLSDVDLKKAFAEKENQGYVFAGIKNDPSDSTFLTLSDVTISSEKTYYAYFYKDDSTQYDAIQKKNITTYINGQTSGTHEFWVGNSSADKNISNDFTYQSNTKVVSLGKTGVETTVGNGVTVRFCMNDGKEYVSFEGTDDKIEPQEAKRQYTVQLKNNVTVNGAFTIGGKFGRDINTGVQSNISGEYVVLDLNGYDITINSTGSLWSYGLIVDSVGTGHIYVNGGSIHTLVVIHDYRGGTATTESVSTNNMMPFDFYQIPYLRAKIVFNYTSNGWGSLYAICHLKAASQNLSIVKQKLELKFIGPESGDYLFKCKTDGAVVGSSRFIFEGTHDNNIVDSTAITNCLNQRIKLTAENMKIIMASLKFSISAAIVNVDVDTGKYNFPVNCFIDFYIINSILDFSQRIQLMPGVTFYIDENSSIIFGYDSSKRRSAQLSSLEKSLKYYDNEYGFINKDLYSCPNGYFGANIFNSAAFWKYYSQARIKIFGKLLFKSGNGSSLPYLLAGPVDFVEGNVGYVDSSGNEHLYKDSTSYSNPFEFLGNNNVHVRTYGFHVFHGFYGDTDTHYKGYSRPLVSNGRAYAFDTESGINRVGAYSFTDGIFRMSDGNTYYFNNGDTYSGDVSSNVTMKSCTYDENTHIINDSGTNYIYFSSMYGQYDGTAVSLSVLYSGYKQNVAFSKGRWLAA